MEKTKKNLEERSKKTIAILKEDLNTVRAGRANPADEEEMMVVAQANEPLTEDGQFINAKVASRGEHGEIALMPREKIDYMDVSPKQVVSVATAMIPFLENDDANRALMGSNMQRQAVPLLVTEAPVCSFTAMVMSV